jgi:hypothetical protein
MNKLKNCLLILILLIAPSDFAEAENSFNYIGSYSFARGTASGHSYVSEFRLWRNGDQIVGIYLGIAGLAGDPFVMVNKIINGTIDGDGKIKIESKWYNFDGRLNEDTMVGVLKQGKETIWGGVDGSDQIILKKGVTIYWIDAGAFKNNQELQAWIATLKNVD